MSTIPRLRPVTFGLLAALAITVAAIAAWAASSAKAVPCLDRTAPRLTVGDGPDIVNPPKAGPDVQDAAFGTLDLAFRLRAERDADGTSRIYAITYAARDHVGRTTTKHATVTVSGLPGLPG